jgi:hypothetical protein
MHIMSGRGTDEAPDPSQASGEGYIVGTDAFLARAQDAGLARHDVRGRDLFLLALAVSWARGAAMADDVAATGMASILRSGWAAHRTT